MSIFEQSIQNYLSKNDVKMNMLGKEHFLYYHHNHMENYANVLKDLQLQSPSTLKCNRKTFIHYNQEEHVFKSSDIHIEIDFELLGVIEFGMFVEFIRHIEECINKPHTYVVCLHFNNVQGELLDVMYAFLNRPRITFLFLSDQISFLPPSILNLVKIVRSKSSNTSTYNTMFKTRMDEMIEWITHDEEHSFLEWREKAYQILIWNDSIHDSFSYMMEKLIEKEYIEEKHLNTVFSNYYDIIYMYNNNYRTIYHLERFIIFLRNLKEYSHTQL